MKKEIRLINGIVVFLFIVGLILILMPIHIENLSEQKEWDCVTDFGSEVWKDNSFTCMFFRWYNDLSSLGQLRISLLGWIIIFFAIFLAIKEKI